jgi:hypothetical protein
MQPPSGANRKNTLPVWIVIAGMVVIGSYSIGFSDITGNGTKTLLVDDRITLKAVQTAKSSDLVSSELAEFFESFDMNSDGELQFSEAEDFFYWIEENIAYRSDDENVLNVVRAGSIAGDGRPGGDYRQTPNETFEERAGDCEDMATLTVAFFNYFGIESYITAVNANSPNALDHAVAIVHMPNDLNQFADYLGQLVYYEVGNGMNDIYGRPISPGVYMLVDNAYSDTFGYLNDGLEPNTFVAHCLIPLQQGYNDEWNRIVSKCG